MAGLMFTWRADLGPARRILGQVQAIGQDLSAPLERSATAARESVARNFEEGGRPEAWEPLKEISLALRRNVGSTQTLLDTGALMRSATTPDGAGSIYELSQAYAKIGTNLVYAALQQAGGTVTPKRAKVLARKVGQTTASAAEAIGWPVSHWNGAAYVILGQSRTILARSYMTVQPEDLVTFGRIFDGWIQEVLAGVS